MLKAILFDHDGTLVASEQIHYQLWLETLAPLGLSLAKAEYDRHFAGMPTRANAELLAGRHPQTTAAELLAAKGDLTRRFLAEAAFPLLPGVARTLARLKAAGLRLAMVTGAGRHEVAASCRAYGFDSLFETIVCGDDVRFGKPHPEPYLLALSRLGLDKDQALAVEDTAHGLASALAAGLGCIAIPNELSQGHDFSGAAAVLADMDAACDWLLSQGR